MWAVPGLRRTAQHMQRADAGLAVDVDVAVPEHLRGNTGATNVAVAAGEAADEFGAGEFGGVELLLATHAVEQAARLLDCDEVEVDILNFDISGPERLGAVIETASKRQSSHFSHLAGFKPGRYNRCRP